MRHLYITIILFSLYSISEGAGKDFDYVFEKGMEGGKIQRETAEPERDAAEPDGSSEYPLQARFQLPAEGLLLRTWTANLQAGRG